jgi:hypothetical protein
MTSSVPPIAPHGSPAPGALASVTMSGVTPNRSVAPPAAMQRPVLTSSKISTIPCLRVISRTASRIPGSGSTTPRFIIAGSMITHAGRRPSAARRTTRPLHRGRVVERHRHREPDHGRGIPAP